MDTAKKKILLVEDEFVYALSLQLMLENLGYEVVGLADCKLNAVEWTSEDKPDLILLDLNLNDQESGFEVFEEIRKFSEVPVIILSGSSDPSNIRHARELGAVEFLVKPVNEKRLRDEIAQVLEARRPAPSA